MCSVLGTYSMTSCPGLGVTGNFVDLYEKKEDKMCSFKCITSLTEIYKSHDNLPNKIEVIIFM